MIIRVSAMSDVIIKNGHLIDPANNIDQITDIHISNGKIAAIGPANTLKTSANTQLIDASELTVIPGIKPAFADLDMAACFFAGREYGGGHRGVDKRAELFLDAAITPKACIGPRRADSC